MARKWNSARKGKGKRKHTHRREIRSRKRKYRKAQRIAGHLGNAVGRAGEERVQNACSYGDFPSWWRGFRRATEEEDREQEKDHVAQTDVGDIPVQIKTHARKTPGPYPLLTRTKKGVPVVHIYLGDSDETIRRQVVNVVEKERKSILAFKDKTSQ